MFKHYLVTRFNLRVPGWEHTRTRTPVLTDDWMTRRMKLFADFCLPSVAQQTARDFQWLIYMDIETRPEYRAQMEAMLASHVFVRLRYIDGIAAFRPSMLDHIAADAAGCTHVITSRIDNDDCLHRDFIALVQSRFRGQEFCVIDVVEGYTLQLHPVVRIGRLEHAFNPFSSLIEKNERPQTIWSRDHGGWKKTMRGQLDSVRGKRLWMSVIHAQNKVNDFAGYGEVDWDAVGGDFALTSEMQRWVGSHLLPWRRWRWRSLINCWHVKTKVWRKMLKHRLGLYRSA